MTTSSSATAALTLDFEDWEGQRLSLVDDGGAGEAHPWDRSPVPARASDPRPRPDHDQRPRPDGDRSRPYARARHERGPGLRRAGERGHAHPRLRDGRGRPGSRAPCRGRAEPPGAEPGAGGVHHVAFRIPDADYGAWAERLQNLRLPSSGPVDRFYFRSLYFREPNGILFEIATDGPGFATDEPLATLGEKLSLPPFLEGRRRQIEAGLRPL